jgi:XTP/dITP diphosphohydrolase
LKEVIEDKKTILENAVKKASEIYKITGRNCFADDTGLEVEELGGKPGVHSKRFAGRNADNMKNIKKLLKLMKNKSNRKARFVTVISLIIDGKIKNFEGICNGHIAKEKKGDKGFGYDSIFIPTGEKLTFAEMDMHKKNIIAHRAIAVKKLVFFLTKEFNANS